MTTQENTLIYNNLNTNGLIYFDTIFNIPPLQLGENGILLLPLFCSLFGSIPTSDKSGKENSLFLNVYSSGFSISPIFIIDSLGKSVFAIRQSGRVLEKHFPQFLILLLEMLKSSNYSNCFDKIRENTWEMAGDLPLSLCYNGHRTVKLNLLKNNSLHEKYIELISGHSQMVYLKKLQEIIKKGPKTVEFKNVIKELENIAVQLINSSNKIINLSCLPEIKEKIYKDIINFSNKLKESKAINENKPVDQIIENKTANTDGKPENPVWINAKSLQVNYMGKIIKIPKLITELNIGAILLGVKILRENILLNSIRIKNGAYGAFCNYDIFEKTLIFLSYRDPQTILTIDNFESGVREMTGVQIDDAQLEKYKISVINSLDPYQDSWGVHKQNIINFLQKKPANQISDLSNQIKHATMSDINNVFKTIQTIAKENKNVIIGGLGPIKPEKWPNKGLEI